MATALSMLPLLAACSHQRNPRWATPLRVEGVPNLFRVSSELFRAAQFTDQGARHLAQEPLRIKTVLSLRSWHADDDLFSPGILSRYGIRCYRLPMTVERPEEEDVLQFLRLVKTAPKPILVHCQQGADRTGFLCAVYRVVVQGWYPNDAIEEMLGGGFGTTLLLDERARYYIRSMDVPIMRARAGLR